MRHDLFTGVFNGAYINHTVRFNVQDAFLESDISDDGLTRAFTHMSIRCNLGAPKEVPSEVMERLFVADPEIVDLERRFKALSTEIKWEYKFIKRAPKEKRADHEDLRKQLTNAKKSLRTEIEDAYRKDYFF
jgi:5-carboxymethyl-2-hydroxymuconate isomerase